VLHSVYLPTVPNDDEDANRSFVASRAISIEKVLHGDHRVRFGVTLASVREAPTGVA